jgi:TetR/AcrR family fatty acid metabolism transcriptional regulator
MKAGLAVRGEDAKRLQILAASVTVFARDGFHKAKVEDIAQAAGVGKGTVYHYFASKEELFQAMVEMCFDKYRTMIRGLLKGPGSLGQHLETLLVAHLEFVWQHRKMAQVMLADNRPLPEKMYRRMWQQRRRMIVYVMRMLKRGMETGEIRPVDLRIASQVILGAFISLGSQLAFGPEIKDRGKLAAGAVQVLMHGLASR